MRIAYNRNTEKYSSKNASGKTSVAASCRPCGFAQCAGETGSQFRFTGNDRDSEEVAHRIGEEVGKAYGVVDIAADVGIEKNFLAFFQRFVNAHTRYLCRGFGSRMVVFGE